MKGTARKFARYSPQGALLVLSVSIVIFLISCGIIGYILVSYGFISPFLASMRWTSLGFSEIGLWIIGIFGIVAGLLGVTSVARSAIVLLLDSRGRKVLWKDLRKRVRVLFLVLTITMSLSLFVLHTFGFTGTGIRMEFQDIIERGASSGYVEPAYYVIQDVNEWTSLWSPMAKQHFPQSPPPQVNFSRTTIIAVFMGVFNYVGPMVEIKEVIDTGLLIVVKVEKTYPSWGCGLLPASTTPCHIVAIDKVNKYVLFETFTNVWSC